MKSYALLFIAALASWSFSGCGGDTNMSRFEGDVNSAYNAGEFSRARGESGYVPQYNHTRISP